jgi:putative ABC transport system ATP-binding protein
MDLMFELNRRSSTTLLLVTPDKALAARCDRLISLDAGKLVGDQRAAA